jgi:hypothetical protein
MKTKPPLLCASVWLLLSLATVNQAQAFLVEYTYIGSNYTQTNAPSEPGFTLSDHVFATISLDSIFWGTTVNGGSGLINSGPWQVGTDAFHVTTDLAGTITAWNLSGAIPGLDISTGGNPDGSGLDNIFGDRPDATGAASVQYAAGPRPPGTGWTLIVPEPSTFALLIVAAIGVAGWMCWRTA